MFVFQNKLTKRYVRRVFQDEIGAGPETYAHVDNLEQATIFAGWWELAEWVRRRGTQGFNDLPKDWQIVEVELVKQPLVKVVKVLG